MKTKLFAFYLLSAFMLVACDNTPKKPDPAEVAEEHNEDKIEDRHVEDDAEFLVKCADNNMLEIELGKLAEKNGKMAEVKSFGKMMAEHHAKMLNDLKALAASKNVTLPESMGDDNRKKLENFSNKAGNEFDKDYIDEMEDAHEKEVKNFEDKSTEDKAGADVKNMCVEALPVLRSHLAEIKKVEEKHEAIKK